MVCNRRRNFSSLYCLRSGCEKTSKLARQRLQIHDKHRLKTYMQLTTTEQLQNTRPRLRDTKHLLPHSRGRVVIKAPAVPPSRSGEKWILNGYRTGAPAVPHSRSGEKGILNGYRTSAPAVPHSRSGEKWILNGYRTSAPAVSHSRSGEKGILNGYRTSAPAVPQSRSGEKRIWNVNRTSAPAVLGSRSGRKEKVKKKNRLVSIVCLFLK